MLILAAVPENLAQKLERAVPGHFDVLAVHSWSKAIKAVRTTSVELGVVDPSLEGEADTQPIEQIARLFPSFPMLVYTALDADSARALLRLGRIGIRRVILEYHDDHPSRIADLLLAESCHVVSRQLAQTVGELLQPCPEELIRAVELFVAEPGEVQSVQEFAEVASMDRRTCLRWFDKAGLPAPSIFLSLVRTILAHRLLLDPGYTVDDVARKVGYSQTRSLAQCVRQFFQMTPREFRSMLTPEEALELVKSKYFGRGKRRLKIVS